MAIKKRVYNKIKVKYNIEIIQYLEGLFEGHYVNENTSDKIYVDIPTQANLRLVEELIREKTINNVVDKIYKENPIAEYNINEKTISYKILNEEIVKLTKQNLEKEIAKINKLYPINDTNYKNKDFDFDFEVEVYSLMAKFSIDEYDTNNIILYDFEEEENRNKDKEKYFEFTLFKNHKFYVKKDFFWT